MSTERDANDYSPDTSIELPLREHNIGCILPPGSFFEGNFKCPNGVLIAGTYIGRLTCESGSVVIQRGAVFAGQAIAERVYVEGDVLAFEGARSTIAASQLIAAGATAKLNADLYSPNFALHKPKLLGDLRPFTDYHPARPSVVPAEVSYEEEEVSLALEPRHEHA